MKKLIFILAVGLCSVFLSSTANAQMPEVYAAGFIEQTDDPATMIHYNAIESNQPVYERYDVELIVDYYENLNYLGRYDFIGINFVEIPVAAPGVTYNFYQQLSYYLLRPVDICGGLIDWFGFSVCYGTDYFFPFTFEGNCAPVCVAAAAVLLGAFAMELENKPTITLQSGNLIRFDPNPINKGGATNFSFRIAGRSDLPSGTTVKSGLTPTDPMGLSNRSLTINYNTDPNNASFVITPSSNLQYGFVMQPVASDGPPPTPSQYSFKMTVDLINTGPATGPGSYSIRNSPQTSTARLTVTGN